MPGVSAGAEPAPFIGGGPVAVAACRRLRARMATTPQITSPATAAPIRTHAHPGRPLDPEVASVVPLSLDAAAATAAAAAPPRFVDVVVVAVVVTGAAAVWVCVTVVDFVGPVTVCVRVEVVPDAVVVGVVADELGPAPVVVRLAV